MPNLELPSTELRDAAWHDVPPDPLENPALYEGLLWRRTFGYLVDAALLTFALACLWFLNILTFTLLTPLVVLLSGLLPLAYHTLFVVRNMATPGMRMFDVEVRSWTGRRPTVAQALVLTLLFYFSVPLTSGLILAVALFTDRNRTLHDLASGTLALRRSRLAATAS